MSYGARVPATLSWSVLPFDHATRAVRASGALLFAAAGNDDENIDGEDSFLFASWSWEEAWHTPAENGGVIAVGGLARDSLNKAGGSNFGPEQVDLYAPYTVWTGPDPLSPGNIAKSVSGTSFSSPYSAGVAALVWAADPSQSAGQVEGHLYQTARNSSDANVGRRVVNAYDAVLATLGDVPPIVDITSPPSGSTFSHSTFVNLIADVDDVEGSVNVLWTSNVDGAIAAGASTRARLSIGTHLITAIAADSAGQTTTDSIVVNIINDPPIMTIAFPSSPSSAFVGQNVRIRCNQL